MPLYDVYCEKCNTELNDLLLNFDENLICPNCNNKMKKKCNCSHFKLVYNNKTDICAWGDNNYETSQYWREINKAKEKGENVKSPDDKY
jgi:hypothetical protein